jgi:hypothetical protein
VLRRLRDWIRGLRRPPTAEELAAKHEADELLDDRDTIRIAARTSDQFIDTGREDRPR